MTLSERSTDLDMGGEVGEDVLDAAVEAALNAAIIPSEVAGRGVTLIDYLGDISPQDAIDLGVVLTEKDKDGKPRFHWYSDLRGDEWDDVQRAILRPLIKAALEASTPQPNVDEGDGK